MSEPIQLTSHNVTCFISGRFDIVVEFDDKTYGVIDFKTGAPNEEYLALYSRQLHAYAYALEHPDKGALGLSPISKMGLLYFFPSKVSQSGIERLLYHADIYWNEVSKNEQGFLGFVKEVLGVLESVKGPEPSPGCQWCSYINKLEGVSSPQK
jgi:hypothetical protein